MLVFAAMRCDHAAMTGGGRGSTGILGGWREQYERMLRSHAALNSVAFGETRADSDEARDRLIHFFQDAYHLKDWIKHDTATTVSGVEGAVTASAMLSLCADICNGIKHLGLDDSNPRRQPRTGDRDTSLTQQHVAVRPDAASSNDGPLPPLHQWTITSDGRTFEATRVADLAVEDWQVWLRTKKLLP